MKWAMAVIAVVYNVLAVYAPATDFIPCVVAGYGAAWVAADMWEDEES